MIIKILLAPSSTAQWGVGPGWDAAAFTKAQSHRFTYRVTSAVLNMHPDAELVEVDFSNLAYDASRPPYVQVDCDEDEDKDENEKEKDERYFAKQIIRVIAEVETIIRQSRPEDYGYKKIVRAT